MDGHRCVLLVAGTRPAAGDLTEVVAPLRAAGARVLLASYEPTDDDVRGLGLDGIRELAPAAQSHGPAFRRAVRDADPPRRVWLHLRDDAWVARQVRYVDAVLWLDPRAKLAARELAAAHDRLTAFGRVDRLLTALHRTPRPAAPRAVARAVAGPAPDPDRAGRGSRWGRLRLAAPGTSDTARAEAAREHALALLRAGRDAEAERRVGSALRRIKDRRVRADLLGDLVSWSLAHGRQPTLARDAYAAELLVADELYAAGDHAAAAESFQEAMRTAFHRSLHFDGLHSPLADDPAGFTAPLERSAVAAALRSPHPTGDPVRDRPEGARPTRLLIATRKNDDFLHEIRGHFEAHPDFDARFHDFLDTPGLERFATNPAGYVEQMLSGGGELPAAVEDAFRAHLDRADVVFVEWCTALAALVSRVDTRGTRVVVRMHAFEAFTPWPQLTDFSRIDDLVFVSDHLRDLAVASTPALRGAHAPRLHVIANAMDLRAFVRPKPPEARFTLGVVGASKLVKDPRWAIEVVRRLRAHDERYRLLLVRGNFQDVGATTREYAEALQRDLDELEPVGAVQRLRHTDDVPAALEQVGVVLSSSVRESFHMGLVEGAASGAVPVVRDWPFFPGSARELFPADWVVGSPEEAAQRILHLTADDQTWRSAGTAASEHVLATWDWAVVSRDFERLLAAHGAAAPPRPGTRPV